MTDAIPVTNSSSFSELEFFFPSNPYIHKTFQHNLLKLPFVFAIMSSQNTIDTTSAAAANAASEVSLLPRVVQQWTTEGRLLLDRSRSYFAMLAGNAISERTTSYKDHEKWVESVTMFKDFQNKSNLPELVETLELAESPKVSEWQNIMEHNVVWAETKADNVSERMKLC